MKLHIIAYPDFFPGEEEVINQILCKNDVVFHLRKPKACENEFEQFLSRIDEKHHHKIVLHDAYSLIEKYNLGGLHFSTSKRNLAANYKDQTPISTSCHSLDEVIACSESFDSCFLSPVFPSISKKGYQGDLDFKAIKSYFTKKRNIKVNALGGIDADKIEEVQPLGFDGVAVLGTLWGDTPSLKDNFSEKVSALLSKIERPFCLCIAGFDPSAGAGVLSDIKTFEANKCYGLAVNTALTFQNDEQFNDLQWIPVKDIIKQLGPLRKYPIRAIKIGLVESFETLSEIISWCSKYFPNAPIIWDPILKASAGFTFHSANNIPSTLLDRLCLITPNADEYKQLNLDLVKNDGNILLKGGHRKDKPGIDSLIINGNCFEIKGEAFVNKTDKHGTGCVLSSAIAASLAQGEPLLASCQRGKKYVEQFIQSNDSRLGYHKF